MSGEQRGLQLPRRVARWRERRHAPFNTSYRQLLTYAHQHRINPTHAEALLWQRLKGRQIGHKVHRQKVLCGYIVDFYITWAKLIIEVDGEYHETQREYDAHRAERLRQHGYLLIRFTNDAVLYDLNGTIAKIKDTLQGFQ